MQFRNNIIDYAAIGNNGFYMQGGLGQGVSAVSLKNCDFANLNYTNNIFVNTAGPGTFYNTGNGLGGANQNNIFGAPPLVTNVGNNLFNANTDSMFVGSLSGYHSTDQQWMVRDMSFAWGGEFQAGAAGGYERACGEIV